MPDTIRLFLCDNHALFRQGLRKLLELEQDIQIVGEANGGQEMLDALKKARPDVILMDICMPEMDGVSATYRARKILPHVNVIMLTVCEDEPHIFQAIKAGAMGYLLKDVSVDEVVAAVRRVYKGEALIQPVIATKVLREFAAADKNKPDEDNRSCSTLTDREKEILHLIALGNTNKEIAQKLDISEKTVKNHTSNIFATLHVTNRTKAAIYALEKKI